MILLEATAQPELLVDAIRKTVEEAESLHVNFIESDSHDPKLLRRAAPHAIEVAQHPSAVSLERALELAHQRVQRVFDLTSDWLFNHEVTRLADGRVAWLHVAHHILLDGYGFNLVARRVAENYGAHFGVQQPSCPGFTGLHPVLAQDVDYQASAKRTEDLEFWKRQQADAPGLTWGEATEPSRGIRVGHALSAELVRALGVNARAAGLDWIDLALAAIARVCGDSCTQKTFSLGTPTMLRLGTAALRTPCMAMNIVPLRVDLTSQPTRKELARQLRDTQVAQRAHGRFRYEHLGREGFAQPVFGPVVNVMPFDFPLSFAGSRAEMLEISAGPVMDLSFSLVVRAGVWTIGVEGHPRLFSRRDLFELLGRVQRELEDEGLSLDSSLPERSRLLLLKVSVPSVPGARLESMALEANSRSALQWDDGILTYCELLRAVDGCAEALDQTGVAAGTIVAVDLPRGPLAAVVLQALHKLGAGYVAIDPVHPESRRRAIFDCAKPSTWVRLTSADNVAEDQSMNLFECSERDVLGVGENRSALSCHC